MQIHIRFTKLTDGSFQCKECDKILKPGSKLSEHNHFYCDLCSFSKKIQKYLLKLKESFLVESDENRKMLDIYVKYIEGNASEYEIEEANYQLKQVLKSLGLGILVILPFSPISIPYILKKAKELEIELIPDWYKALRKDEDRIE